VQSERQEFVSTSKFFDDINAVKGVSADWAVFAGMGEPTLATNLGEAITMVKSVLGLPVAVMTNGSLIKHKDVRKALGWFPSGRWWGNGNCSAWSIRGKFP
jgi:wyosine [tRNA(Phe)-imidazoG37] synthetase (radical SAM superfamily)